MDAFVDVLGSRARGGALDGHVQDDDPVVDRHEQAPESTRRLGPSLRQDEVARRTRQVDLERLLPRARRPDLRSSNGDRAPPGSRRDMAAHLDGAIAGTREDVLGVAREQDAVNGCLVPERVEDRRVEPDRDRRFWQSR